MSHKLNSAIAVVGIDIGKNSFHVVGQDKRGAIVDSVPAQPAPMPLIGKAKQRQDRRSLPGSLEPPCAIGCTATAPPNSTS